MDSPRRVQAIILILLASLLLPSAIPLRAQIDRLHDDWRWVRFDVSSGLPSPRVLDVFEASDGKIWALTSGGVAWFDGFRWTPVDCSWLRSHPVDLPGIVIRGACLAIAGMDSLVVVNSAGCTPGIIPPAISKQAGAQPSDLEGIITRIDTSIMIVRHDSLIHVASPLDTLSDCNLRMKEAQWGLLYYSQKPWLRIGDALYRWTGNAWNRLLRTPRGYLKVILIETDDHDNGIGVFEDEPGRVSVYGWSADGAARRDPREEGDLIKSIAFTPSGEILAVENTGALRIKRKDGWSLLPKLPPFISNPLMIKFRRNGDLWVGTANGLFLCRMSSERWVLWKSGSSTRENIINEILPARDGSFWIGTRDGVQIRDPDGKVRWVKSIDGQRLGRVTGIVQARNGDIWISSGASFSGAYRWDGRSWKHFGEAEGLASRCVHKIVSDRQGRLWFLGMSGGVIQPNYATEPGAFMLDGSGFSHWGKNQGLLNDRVYSLVQDRKGTLWFGTFKGLSRWRDGRWTYWQQGSGLKGNRVFALAEDSTGRIWFGQNWHGLGYIDDRDSVQYLTTADGLVDNQVWGLTVDPEGRVWIATMDGLGCYSKGQWLTFDTQSGLPNAQLWPVVTVGGKVYAGTQGSGVAVLNYQPSEIPDPKIEFERPLERAEATTIQWSTYSFWAEPPREQILTRSRVDGGEWNPWSTDHSLLLSRTSPGDHVIEVQSRGIFGKTSSDRATMEFDIPRPVIFRPIFYVPIALLLALLAGVTANHLHRKNRFEAALRENEQRFRAQYQSNPIPTFTWQRKDHDFILADCNEVAKHLMGGMFASQLGLPMKHIARFVPQFIDLADKCYRDRASSRSEVLFPLPAPEVGTVIMDVSMVYVPPDMLLVHARNISQEKMASQQIEESREQLRALAARLESVREEERKNLSREIHDELGQAMTGLKMDLAWIRRRLAEGRRDTGELVNDRLTRMGNLLDDTLQSVRRIAGTLRPVMLDDLGLAAAIEWQAKDFQQRTGITTLVDITYEDSVLGKEQSTEVFRIFQELLTNIARHAGATNVEIRLEAQEHALTLEVTDDGSGITSVARRASPGLGILGMEERARRAGGKIDIGSVAGKGTAVRVSIPLKEFT
jgi:signal transduction histidine kinase/sugar lactone lactonase YvrE